MVTLPAQTNDQYLAALEQQQGFSDNRNISNSSVNNSTRQSRIPNDRFGTPVRNMVRWLVPEVGVVEMYVNPSQIQYQYKKDIATPTKTKGGFVTTYWGEQLATLAITGSTGSSGVEGINVLEEIYRAEQYAFDPYALALASNNAQETEKDFLPAIVDSVGDNLFSAFSSSIETGSPTPTRPAPTLAALAFSVEMYWSGWAFRGYFNDFTVTESAEKLGIFDYTMNFTVTQRRGIRLNYLPWHRSAVNGPSNSHPVFGTPYSFSTYGVNGSLTGPPRQGTTLTEGVVNAVTGTTNRALGDLNAAFGSIF